MKVRFANSAQETGSMNTESLRSHFLIEDIVVDNEINLVYSHYDRVITGGVKPVNKIIQLENDPELRAEFFLERREIGIINVAGNGVVVADGERFSLRKLDCLYLGKGVGNVSFESEHAGEPAVFYLLSAPAHANYPNRLLPKEEASQVQTGSSQTSNARTIYKYIHDQGIQSCQLVMGLTILEPGSVWNTMPAHTHTRRMEAYFYFDVPLDQRVFHFMGEPKETRHLVVSNYEAIVSPPWSIHSGCGTANYSFIWGMAGENYNYTDMDLVPVTQIK
ncbi:MAG: 5-dehydro-4-deoxy-D-glucuronate isomerase [Flavitalea sp.]